VRKCLKVSRSDRVELSQFTVFFYGGPRDHLLPGGNQGGTPSPFNIHVSLSSNNKFTKLSFDLTRKENNHPMCGWSLYEVIEPGAHLEGRSNMPNQLIFQNDIEPQYETPTNRSTDFDPSKKSYRIQNQYHKFSHCFFISRLYLFLN